MRRRSGRRCGVILVMAVAAACKRSPPPAAPVVDAGPPTPAPKVELPARGVGMEDPFARLKPESVKALNAGYLAMRARKNDEARAAFATLVAAHPDHTAGRFMELRSAAMADQFDKV